jgi:hypothetical protein
VIAATTGITSGHATGADLCFLIGIILGVIAAAISQRPPMVALAPLFGWLAVAAISFGLFLL